MPRFVPGLLLLCEGEHGGYARGAVEGFGDGGEAGGVDLCASGEEAAEAHDERAPFDGIDVVGLAFEAEVRRDVDAEDFYLEGDEAARGFGGGDGVGGGEGGLELDGTLSYAWGGDEVGGLRGEAGGGELVAAGGVALGELVGRDGIGAGEERKAIDIGGLVDGGEVEDAVVGALDVLRGLGLCAEAEDGVPAEPPGRGDGGEVGGAVFVEAADEDDRSAEVEDRWVDGLVHVCSRG